MSDKENKNKFFSGNKLVIIAAILVIWLYFWAKPSRATSGNNPGGGINHAGNQIPGGASADKTIMHDEKAVYDEKAVRVVSSEPIEMWITDQNRPLHVVVPVGYHVEASWGNAPLDVRTSAHPDWIMYGTAPDGRIEGGQQVQWDEWRLNSGYNWKPLPGGKGYARVTLTYIKLPGRM